MLLPVMMPPMVGELPLTVAVQRGAVYAISVLATSADAANRGADAVARGYLRVAQRTSARVDSVHFVHLVGVPSEDWVARGGALADPFRAMLTASQDPHATMRVRRLHEAGSIEAFAVGTAAAGQRAAQGASAALEAAGDLAGGADDAVRVLPWVVGGLAVLAVLYVVGPSLAAAAAAR